MNIIYNEGMKEFEIQAIFKFVKFSIYENYDQLTMNI